MIQAFRLVAWFGFIMAVGIGSARAFDTDYLRELQQRALEQRLHEDRYWHKLLHYKADLFGGGYTSLVDSPEFFNAADGKTDPRAELLATLEGFFSQENVRREDVRQSRQCAYIERFHWLKRRLEFDENRLPNLACNDFENWVSTIAPQKLTLIFPSAYLNNPSSMFGHTLLRIDKQGLDENSQLVSFSINFAARTDESSGIVFAYKGLIGQYPGYFSVLPYYEKVNEYNDLENRDIWEFTLNLDRAEILRVLRHTWELAGIYFDYYFIDENCSYQLLELIQVARPEFEFTRAFPVWATPVDTLRVVLEEGELLETVTYRPAARTRIEHQSRYLSASETDLVLDLAFGRRAASDAMVSALPPERRALVVESAYDYLQYLLKKGELGREPVARRSIGLLRVRSLIDASSPAREVPRPEYRPDQGHETSMLGLRRGRLEDAGYGELTIRPTYHDLLDRPASFVDGNQLSFMSVDLRYSDDDEDLELQRIDFFDAISLSRRSPFFDPLSWKLKLSYARQYGPAEVSDELVLAFDGGIGLAWKLGSGTTLYALLDGAIWIDDEIPDDVAVGAGANLGLQWYLSDRWTLGLSLRSIEFHNNLRATVVDHAFSSNFSLSRNTALRITWRETGEARNSLEDASLGFRWYF